MPKEKLSYVLEELEISQGWNRDTIIDLLTEWVEYHSTEESDLIQFLRDKAEEENEE
jgi:hypothetical protein